MDTVKPLPALYLTAAASLRYEFNQFKDRRHLYWIVPTHALAMVSLAPLGCVELVSKVALSILLFLPNYILRQTGYEAPLSAFYERHISIFTGHGETFLTIVWGIFQLLYLAIDYRHTHSYHQAHDVCDFLCKRSSASLAFSEEEEKACFKQFKRLLLAEPDVFYEQYVSGAYYSRPHSFLRPDYDVVLEAAKISDPRYLNEIISYLEGPFHKSSAFNHRFILSLFRAAKYAAAAGYRQNALLLLSHLEKRYSGTDYQAGVQSIRAIYEGDTEARRPVFFEEDLLDPYGGIDHFNPFIWATLGPKKDYFDQKLARLSAIIARQNPRLDRPTIIGIHKELDEAYLIALFSNQPERAEAILQHLLPLIPESKRNCFHLDLIERLLKIRTPEILKLLPILLPLIPPDIPQLARLSELVQHSLSHYFEDRWPSVWDQRESSMHRKKISLDAAALICNFVIKNSLRFQHDDDKAFLSQLSHILPSFLTVPSRDTPHTSALQVLQRTRNIYEEAVARNPRGYRALTAEEARWVSVPAYQRQATFLGTVRTVGIMERLFRAQAMERRLPAIIGWWDTY